MDKLNETIKGLEKVWDAFNHMEHELYADYVFDALELLKEQQEKMEQPTAGDNKIPLKW